MATSSKLVLKCTTTNPRCHICSSLLLTLVLALTLRTCTGLPDCDYTLTPGNDFVSTIETEIANWAPSAPFHVCVQAANYTGCGDGFNMKTNSDHAVYITGLSNAQYERPIVDCEGSRRVVDMSTSNAEGYIENLEIANGNVFPFEGGGAIRVSAGSLTLTSVVISGSDEGAVYVDDGELYVFNSTLTNNPGRAIETNELGSATIHVENSSLVGNSGTAAYLPAAITVIVSSLFEANVYQSAAAIYLDLLSELRVYHSVFNANTASGSGGAGVLSAFRATYTLFESCEFTNNVASTNSGGVFKLQIYSGVRPYEFVVNNSVITGNSAVSSSVLSATALTYSLDTTFRNCTIAHNTASGSATMYIASSVVSLALVDCVVDSNTAQRGGALYTKLGAALTLSRIVVSNNVATLYEGGGVYVDSDAIPFVMSDTRFVGNSAAGTGGAIYWQIAYPLIITSDIVISDNTANKGGGLAVDVPVNLTLDDATLSGNVASGTGGGAVYVTNGARLRLSNGTRLVGNSAASSGGGVRADSAGTVVSLSDGAVVDGNSAANGGGVYLSTAALRVEGATDVTITNNIASNSGGGVYAASSATVSFGGSSGGGGESVQTINVAGNSAGWGGVVWASNSVVEFVCHTLVTSDSQASNGHLFAASTGSTLTVSTDTELVVGQKAGDGGNSNGGGFYASGSTVTITSPEGVSLVGNWAKNTLGGAVSATLSSNVFISSPGLCNLSSNWASLSGGAVSAYSSFVSVDCDGGVVADGCVARGGSGGAIYAEESGGSVVVSAPWVSLSGNGADGNGGAIEAYLSASVTVDTPGSIAASGNVAGGDGGAVHADDSASVLLNSSTLTVSGCSAAAGGAVASEFLGSVTLSVAGTATVADNTATGDGGGFSVSIVSYITVNADSLVMTRCSAGGSGGAISVFAGTMSINAALRVEHCVAFGGFGGGVAVNGDTMVLTNAAAVVNCTAASGGGGVYAIAGGELTSAHELVVTGNTALGADGGGGVLVVGVSAVEISSDGFVLSNNTAVAGSGGGASVDNQGSLTLSGSGRVSGNIAAAHGGAVSLTDASVFVVMCNGSCTLSSNTAVGYGGALYVADEGSSARVDGVVMKSNAARLGGTATVLFDAQLSVSNCRVSSNSAVSVAGGVFAFATPRVSLLSTPFVDNNNAAVFTFFTTNVSVVGCGFAATTVGGTSRVVVRGAGLLTLVDSALTAGPGAAPPLHLVGVGDVRLSGSLIGSTDTAAIQCSSAAIVANDSVVCSASASRMDCTSCTYSGGGGGGVDGGGCLVGPSPAGSCAASCAASALCLSDAAAETAPNLGCYSCSGSCWAGSDDCNATSTLCVDVPPSDIPDNYECSCETGFAGLSPSGLACSDVDECSGGGVGEGLCVEPALCTNTVGSFVCTCPAGYINSSPTECVDVDECSTGTPCAGVNNTYCVNALGTYSCDCADGYYRWGNSTECRPCPPAAPFGFGDTCVATCPVGYGVSGPNSTLCLDINECTAYPAGTVCDKYAKCINTVGSFSCGGCVANSYIYGGQPQCRPCAPGNYVLNGVACLPCGASTFTDEPNLPACLSCRDYSVSNASRTGCDCIDGFVYDDLSDSCIANCSLGTYPVVPDVCIGCPLGTYGSAPGVCSQCPTFSTTTTTGSTSVVDCVCIADTSYADPANVSAGCSLDCPAGSFVNSAIDCVDCPLGTYNDNTTKANECTPCPDIVGITTVSTGSVSVDNCTCGPNKVVETQKGKLVCTVVCDTGFSRPNTDSCEICGLGNYSPEPNAPQCLNCPANTWSPRRAASLSECSCKAGFYHPRSVLGQPCTPCPTGGKCNGGTQQPVARPGYYPVDADDSEGASFVQCTPVEACSGGGECEKGYAGDRCAACDRGYHRVGGYCQPCKDAGVTVLSLGVLAITGLCAGMIGSNLRSSTLAHATSLVIGLNALQVVAKFGRLTIAWPAAAQQALNVVSVVSMNVEIAGPECVVGGIGGGGGGGGGSGGGLLAAPFFVRFYTTMGLPLLVVAILLVLYAVFSAVRVSGYSPVAVTHEELTRSVLQTSCQMALYLYLPLSSTVFEFFDCVPAGSIKVLDTSPDVVCYSDAWKANLPYAVIFVLLYPVGIPLLFGLVLWYYKTHLSETMFAMRFGFLTIRYRESVYFYELAVLARKLAIVFCFTFISASPYVKAGAVAAVVIVVGSVHGVARPFEYTRHNRFESVCLCVVTAVFLVGISYQDDSLSDVGVTVTLILFVGGLVMSVPFAVVWDIVQLRRDSAKLLGGSVTTVHAASTAYQSTVTDDEWMSVGLDELETSVLSETAEFAAGVLSSSNGSTVVLGETRSSDAVASQQTSAFTDNCTDASSETVRGVSGGASEDVGNSQFALVPPLHLLSPPLPDIQVANGAGVSEVDGAETLLAPMFPPPSDSGLDSVTGCGGAVDGGESSGGVRDNASDTAPVVETVAAATSGSAKKTPPAKPPRPRPAAADVGGLPLFCDDVR